MTSTEHPSPEPPSSALVAGLTRLLAQQTGGPVECIETHISWVLLAGERAYKLKKPVRLPFADFSSPEARHHFCEEELRLNRRLAPQLYLSVLAVGGTPSAPTLGPSDAPLDHLVCMRRFPGGALLGERLAAGQLTAQELTALARQLAAFHQRAPVAAADGAHGSVAGQMQAVRAVLDQLDALCPGPVPTLLRAHAEAEMAVLAPVWQARLRQGAVREGHGDLHLGNAVLLDGQATAFDCIEFDPALRWIDVMADVAFLTMDLKAHGRPDLAAQFLDAYLQATGDWGGLAVLRFAELYRALVRAMVQAREHPAQTSLYLDAALRLVQEARRPARLMITHGPSGAGKSTWTARLLALTGAVRLRSDVERKRLFGLEALQDSRTLGLDIYTPEATQRTFDTLFDGAVKALAAGFPVIVDAVFSRRDERQRFRRLAQSLGLPFALLDCRAEPAELRRRVQWRQQQGGDASEAGLAVLQAQLERAEALGPDEQAGLLVAEAGASDAGDLARRWLAISA
ncbi:MAG: AAA family ATPase [Curvibacter sp.]|nr:AAA family ATPase [Curvibacter sp.]